MIELEMSKFVSPFCLLLALALLVAAGAIIASGAPAENVAIHAARSGGDELVENALTSRLAGRILVRRLLLAGLFCGSILLTILSFLSMRENS